MRIYMVRFVLCVAFVCTVHRNYCMCARRRRHSHRCCTEHTDANRCGRITGSALVGCKYNGVPRAWIITHKSLHNFRNFEFIFDCYRLNLLFIITGRTFAALHIVNRSLQKYVCSRWCVLDKVAVCSFVAVQTESHCESTEFTVGYFCTFFLLHLIWLAHFIAFINEMKQFKIVQIVCECERCGDHWRNTKAKPS